MALRSELSELLAGFEKRMKFINIVRCLLDYKYPEHIREMIPDKRVLDNMIVAVLVFIKDRTLGTEQTCTIEDVERFLEDFSVVLPADYHTNPKILARYIIVDVLQNGGVMAEFTTFYSANENFEPMSIRLINEEKGSYHLTDDAFDFLFRSKEIESELDYSVTRFRMKEYMRRDNYEEALDASRELVSRIRNMKVSMDDFLLRCREDISKITVDQYETVISRIRSLLEDEYKELTEIQKAAKERAKNLEEALQNGVGTEETQKHRSALKEAIRVDAYKIDQNPQNAGYRSWEQTQINNSGAEKFVVYFAVILSLMNYTRGDFGSVRDKDLRSALILDNPFGATSSKHILVPMFAIAKHFRVQMICLSDINKSDVINCFDIVIKAIVKKRPMSNNELLTHEGNESIEHGFYRSEQLSLL